MTDDVRELVVHAIDLASMREFDAAKELLEPLDDPIAGRVFLLIVDWEQREQAFERGLQFARHEIGNALSVAQANLEGMADGIIEPTPERIEHIVTSLRSAGTLLNDLRRVPLSPADSPASEGIVDADAIIAAAISAVVTLANGKNVEIYLTPSDAPSGFRGNATSVARRVRKTLLDGVRYAPPHGTLEISLSKDALLSVAVRSGDGTVGELQRLLQIRLPLTPAA